MATFPADAHPCPAPRPQPRMPPGPGSSDTRAAGSPAPMVAQGWDHVVSAIAARLRGALPQREDPTGEPAAAQAHDEGLLQTVRDCAAALEHLAVALNQDRQREARRDQELHATRAALALALARNQLGTAQNHPRWQADPRVPEHG